MKNAGGVKIVSRIYVQNVIIAKFVPLPQSIVMAVANAGTVAWKTRGDTAGVVNNVKTVGEYFARIVHNQIIVRDAAKYAPIAGDARFAR